MKINYVLASWSGKRGAIEHTGGYLRKHLRFLNSYRNNIAQVTIGNPFNPDEPAEYEEYLKSLKTLDNGTPIVILDQPNFGRSYGHWSRTYDKYRDEFDYYIFIEDDYVPAVDDFDAILVRIFKEFEAEKCGFLCGMYTDGKGGYKMRPCQPHAGISNGIASKEALAAVWDVHGMLPHDQGDYKNGQLAFSQGFLDAGYTIRDHLHKFRSLYYAHDDEWMRWYSVDGQKMKDIIVPIQYAENPDKWKFQYYTINDQPPGQREKRSRYS